MRRFLSFFSLLVLVVSCRPTAPALTPRPSDLPTIGPTPRTIPATWTVSPPPAEAAISTSEAALPPATPSAPDYWPTDDWRTASPESQGMNPGKLEAMFAAIEAQALNVDGVVVVRNGYIITESYYAPTTQQTGHRQYSCTKSFISALVGMAIAKGYLAGVDQPVLASFPNQTFANPDSRKDAITLEHLLTMSAGLNWVEGDDVYRQMWQSGDWVKFVLDRRMVADPGADFNYSSGVSHVLSGLVRQSTGKLTQDFAQEHLFTPLGIAQPHWDEDADGLAIGGWGLVLTPREMAKLGFLYLHGGMWDGRQVVPAEWVKTSTTAHIKTGDDLDYGYQWWVYPKSDAYAALGRDGQIIFVAPEANLVAVFTAQIAQGTDPLLDLIDTYILPAVEK